MKTVWVSWEKHRRTREIAKALPCVELHEITFEAPRVIRYLVLLWRTADLMRRVKPKIMLIQNPSILLALFALTLGRIWAVRIVIDAHNEGLQPFSNRLHRLIPLYHFIQKHADLTIVTNTRLAKIVENNGGRPFVLPDRIPSFPNRINIPLKGKYNVVFVCTFEKDEPYHEVIKAARQLGPSIYVYLTGRFDKVPAKILAHATDNIIFTGYLDDQEYINLLFSCDAVMDLTLMEDCLVCGAYEATALGKPMILSDTKAMREYFNSGAVFTANQAIPIARSIKQAITLKNILSKETIELKKRRTHEWQKSLKNLIDFLQLSRSNSMNFN